MSVREEEELRAKCGGRENVRSPREHVGRAG